MANDNERLACVDCAVFVSPLVVPDVLVSVVPAVVPLVVVAVAPPVVLLVVADVVTAVDKPDVAESASCDVSTVAVPSGVMNVGLMELVVEALPAVTVT